MRVTRVQAEENRQNVINTASRLFRQRGYDGIGVSDLMKAAGLTQGGFYKQFESKEDLAAQASVRAMETSARKWAQAKGATSEPPLDAVLRFYLSPAHRDQPGEGCPLVALAADAARHGPALRAAFESGITDHLAVLDAVLTGAQETDIRQKSLAVLATMVGALLLARVVQDDALSRDFLTAAAEDIRTRCAP